MSGSRQFGARMTALLAQRRPLVALGTASALVLSGIGGSLVLLLDEQDKAPAPAALAPIEPGPAPAAEPEPEAESSDSMDLSMFGFGAGDLAGGALPVSDTPVSAPPAEGMGQSALLPGISGAPGALPALQLPPAPQLPATPDLIDWNAVLGQLVAAQASAQSANVAGSIVGTTVGATAATLNSAAVLAGDLILYAALSNNGGQVLNEMQTALAAAATAGTLGAAGTQLPPPDLAGLSAAFAAAAAAPPGIGIQALPPLPAPPQLPTPEQVIAGVGLGAAALPALPALGSLPGLPPPPQLPRPEDVVGGVAGGIVALAITGAVLGTIGAIFQPPSLTRLMGLPF